MITLRPATKKDAEALGRLFTASRSLLDFLPRLHTPQEDIAYITGHILPNNTVTIAEDDGTVAGYSAETPGWLEHLYVHPNHLRRGIASKLLQSAMARHGALELWCFVENHRGRALYEKHGFTEIARTDGSENEEHAPDIRYRWQRG